MARRAASASSARSNCYIDHRREVIRRRTEYQLEKAREREHVLEGLLKAIDMLDAVIATIRASDSANNALELLQGDGHRRRRAAPREQPGRAPPARPAPTRSTSPRSRRAPSSICSSAASPPSNARPCSGRVRRAHQEDRLPRRPAREPAQDRLPHPRRHAGAEEEVRRRPPHRNRRGRPRGLPRRRPRRPPGERHHAQHPQLHQAHAARGVPRRSAAAARAHAAPPRAKKTPS